MACTQCTIDNVTRHSHGSTILKYLENELYLTKGVSYSYFRKISLRRH